MDIFCIEHRNYSVTPSVNGYRSGWNTYLARDGVRGSKFVTPVTTSDWYNGQLSEDDGTPNSSGNLLGTFYAKTNMTIEVSKSNNSFEPGSLSSSCLLLDRHNLQYLVLQCGSKEVINDLKLLKTTTHSRYKDSLLQFSCDDCLMKQQWSILRSSPSTQLQMG